MILQTSFDVPVLMILYNRPDHAWRVFDKIKELRPKSLFIAVDGAKPERTGDAQAVTMCQKLVDAIDWPCQVKTLFREVNLGCKIAVSSAISWFFEHVEFGIILEDDCLPDSSFFNFCRELLLRYEMNERVMHIGGANLIPDQQWSSNSYIFTKICHIWGWATWRRAWKHYDVNMKSFPEDTKSSFINQQVSDKESIKYWKHVFAEAYNQEVDTWDYQWVYAIWKQQGLCVLPEHNLITNIGYDASATHTTLDSPFANMPTIAINSIRHPEQVDENTVATEWIFAKLYRLPSGILAFKNNIKRRLRLLKTLYS